MDIDATSTNRTNPLKIPVGATFTVNTSGNTTEYTVTGRTLSTGVDEVQTFSGTGASTGSIQVTLTLAPDPTNPALSTVNAVFTVAFDAASAAVQTALDSAVGGVLSTYVAGHIAATGGALNTTAITLTYSGASVAKANHSIAVLGVSGYDGTEASATTTEGEFVDQVTNIVFSPAWGTSTPADDDTITWGPIHVAVKIGEGNLTYTENKEYEYLTDRGTLDVVREGDEQPMDVTIDFVYEFVRTGTSEAITPVDALKGIGGASEFTSSSADACEPYAVDVEVDHNPTCLSVEKEVTLFPDFRHDTLEFDLDEATISVTGRCNAIQPTITRVVV